MKTSVNNNQNIESMRQQIATAISSNETIAKHVERIEIQEYCVYVYVDTRRASEKAMKQVQTSNRHLFAYVNYIKGKGVSVPYICYDLTGKAYNAIKREDKAEEKARREREALEAVEREKAEKQARRDAALALSWEREDKGLPIGEGEFALLRGIEGYVIGETEDGCLVFRNEGDTWTETQPLSQFARIMREKPEWVRKGQTVKFKGWLFEIETEDALGEDHDVFIRKQGEEPKCPKCYRKAVLMVRYETLTPCTPDGRELLPEPPKEITIDEEPTLETSSEITDGAKKESFGKMFIYRLYIKWKWMQQRFERIGDMDHAADCFYHRLRLTKLYIYQPGWRIMDYGDMKPIFFPRQRIK